MKQQGAYLVALLKTKDAIMPLFVVVTAIMVLVMPLCFAHQGRGESVICNLTILFISLFSCHRHDCSLVITLRLFWSGLQ